MPHPNLRTCADDKRISACQNPTNAFTNAAQQNQHQKRYYLRHNNMLVDQVDASDQFPKNITQVTFTNEHLT
jgi:hypothetical protein